MSRAGLAVLLCLALAACGDDTPPQVFAPLDYGYLTKLRLNVAGITIEDARPPDTGGGAPHAESLSPVTPYDGLKTLAAERLVASGNAGQGHFVIEDASIVEGPGRLDGALAVRLDVETSGGTKSGFAEAKVVRTQAGGPADPDGGRNAAYQLTKSMLDDMNVELEFQIRHSLHDYLQSTSGALPASTPVQSQDLPPPPGVTVAPPTQPGS